MPIRKNFGPIKCPRKKNYIYEITTRKNIGPSNYRREDILDPRNTHEKNVRIHEARWYKTHNCKGPREFSTLRLIDGQVFYLHILLLQHTFKYYDSQNCLKDAQVFYFLFLSLYTHTNMKTNEAPNLHLLQER